MGATTMLHVRVDAETKAGASAALDRMGLTLSEGVRVFLRRVAAEQALPFRLEVPGSRTPTARRRGRTGGWGSLRKG